MTYGALAVASRRRVLEVLRESGGPQDAVAVARATGLHPNTVRFHLRVLIEAGYVTQATGSRAGRGRPQAVYASVTPAPGPGGYALLAEMLAGRLDDAAGAALARQAVESWLRRAAAADRPAARAARGQGTPSLDEVADRATALFAEFGFDPVRVPAPARPRPAPPSVVPASGGGSATGGGSAAADGWATGGEDGVPGGQPGAARIELRSCPFLDVARRHPDVVCGVHLGLLRGLAEQAAAGAFATELFPFARPGVCAAEIRRAADAQPSPSPSRARGRRTAPAGADRHDPR